MANYKSLPSEADVRLINNKLMAVEGTSRTSRQITLEDLGGSIDPSSSFTKDVNVLIGDGETVIPSGVEGYSAPVTFSGTVTTWSLAEVSIPPVSGTISIDVLKTDSASYPTFNVISNLNNPSLNGEYTNSSSDLDSWDRNLSVGDSIGFKVNSNLNCKQIHLIVSVEAGN